MNKTLQTMFLFASLFAEPTPSIPVTSCRMTRYSEYVAVGNVALRAHHLNDTANADCLETG